MVAVVAALAGTLATSAPRESAAAAAPAAGAPPAGASSGLVGKHLIGVGFSWPTSALLVQDFTDILMPQWLGGDHPELRDGGTLREPLGYLDAAAAAGDRRSVIESMTREVRWLQTWFATWPSLVRDRQGCWRGS